MKNKFKNIIICGLVATNIVTLAKNSDISLEKTISSEEFEEIVLSAIEGTTVEIKDKGLTNSGNYYIDLNDGSWVVYNKETKTTHFQPIELGDWDYELKIKDVKNCINSYSMLKQIEGM